MGLCLNSSYAIFWNLLKIKIVLLYPLNECEYLLSQWGFVRIQRYDSGKALSTFSELH